MLLLGTQSSVVYNNVYQGYIKTTNESNVHLCTCRMMYKYNRFFVSLTNIHRCLGK